MRVELSVPNELAEVLTAEGRPLDRQIALDLAVAYYERGLISVGKAAELAGLSRMELERVLGERRVVRNYNEHDLRADLEFARTGIPGGSNPA